VTARVKVDDIHMYYEVKGEGFPLVMITGLSENLECWDPSLVEALSRRFKLVLFDNRDSGRTDTSNQEYSMKTLADDTAGLMDALEISKAHVLGFSMGGMVAQELVLHYPEKVSKLVLYSTSSNGRLSHELTKIASALERGSSTKEIAEMYLSLPGASDYPSNVVRKTPSIINCYTADFVKENANFVNLYHQRCGKHPISEQGWRRQYNAQKGFNAQGRLQQINTPTLVLHGKKDFPLPPEKGSNLAKAIPNAKLVFFEKSAHMLAEEMPEVIRAITEFLV
jgi:pimeloyl-ACP methyl ester carboxylesterase